MNKRAVVGAAAACVVGVALVGATAAVSQASTSGPAARNPPTAAAEDRGLSRSRTVGHHVVSSLPSDLLPQQVDDGSYGNANSNVPVHSLIAGPSGPGAGPDDSPTDPRQVTVSEIELGAGGAAEFLARIRAAHPSAKTMRVQGHEALLFDVSPTWQSVAWADDDQGMQVSGQGLHGGELVAVAQGVERAR